MKLINGLTALKERGGGYYKRLLTEAQCSVERLPDLPECEVPAMPIDHQYEMRSCQTLDRFENSRLVTWRNVELKYQCKPVWRGDCPVKVSKHLPLQKLSQFHTNFCEVLQEELVRYLPTNEQVRATRALDQTRWDLTKLTDTSLKEVATDLPKDIKLLPEVFHTLDFYTPHEVDTDFKHMLDRLKEDQDWFCSFSASRPEYFWFALFMHKPTFITDELKSIVQKALVIALGSADAERIFSQMNLVMDKHKTAMGDGTLIALIAIRHSGLTYMTIDTNKAVKLYESEGYWLCDHGTKYFEKENIFPFNNKFFGIKDPKRPNHAVSTNGQQIYSDYFWKRTDQLWAFVAVQDYRQWKMQPDGTLLNKVFGSNWKFGTKNFVFREVDDYILVCEASTDLALEVYSTELEDNIWTEFWTDSNGVEVKLTTRHGNPNQQWIKKKFDKDNWFRLRSKHSGLFLQVSKDGQELALQMDGVPKKDYTKKGIECLDKCSKKDYNYNWCKVTGDWDYCIPHDQQMFLCSKRYNQCLIHSRQTHHFSSLPGTLIHKLMLSDKPPSLDLTSDHMFWYFIPDNDKMFLKVMPTSINQGGCVGTLLAEDFSGSGDVFLFSPCPTQGNGEENNAIKIHTKYFFVWHPKFIPVKKIRNAISTMSQPARANIEL